MRRFLPDTTSTAAGEGAAHTAYSVAYAVHERGAERGADRLIGLVTLVPAVPGLALAPPLVPAADANTLVVELAYMFLPAAWGRGLATEAVRAVVGAAREAKGTGFWDPWERVWMRVIVNERNGASGRVLEKVGVPRMGVYVWEGERMWIGGKWVVKEELVIYGAEIV
jgi:RimJ/RimL family protein N-acetyltransferase